MRSVFVVAAIVVATAICLPARGAIAFGTYTYGAYQTTSYSYTPVGANSEVILALWHDNAIVTAPTFGGVTMTRATTHAATHPFAGSLSIYYLLGVGAGSATLSITNPGQVISGIFSVSGQSGTQPDSTATFVTSTMDGSGDAALAFTTVHNNSFAIAVYGCSTSLATSTTTGTFIGGDASFQSFAIFASAAAISPAGAYTVKGRGVASGAAYDAVGMSISPFSAVGGSQAFIF